MKLKTNKILIKNKLEIKGIRTKLKKKYMINCKFEWINWSDLEFAL